MSSPAPDSTQQQTTVSGGAVASSVAAVVLLVAGWLYSVSLVPGFDVVRHPVSDLTASNAPDRWVMTVVLMLVAGCHVVTALGLRPADPAGRWLLGAGGVSLFVLTLIPNRSIGQYYLVHTYWSALTFMMLAAWPTTAARFGARVVWPLRLRVGLTASLVTFLLVLAAVLGIITEAPNLGLREEALFGFTTLWPLVVVLGARRGAHRPEPGPTG